MGSNSKLLNILIHSNLGLLTRFYPSLARPSLPLSLIRAVLISMSFKVTALIYWLLNTDGQRSWAVLWGVLSGLSARVINLDPGVNALQSAELPHPACVRLHAAKKYLPATATHNAALLAQVL